ncbi:pilus assembly protein PilN [Psychromonas sp. B3M02]|uniref:PilN domain-containing protein n=1 Tax=unclassified Psychromonas TaxID=2614957 RepID=UPI000DE99137|nr:PilN domain-containing protein [Psychromonas sp. B3M02]RBW45117.1 pilus assembly protein PilN [Psychromonas sp. B3M02]
MSNINLLPWRENYKKQKKTAFFILLGISALIALALSYAGKMYVDSLIDAQNQRNQYLQTETIILDRRIAEISDIKKQKAELVRRIDLIQELEAKRNIITRFFNTLPEVTPSGVYTNSITFDKGKADVRGLSDSTNQVSNMLRNVDNSGWLGDAALPSIVSGPTEPIKLYNFSMNFIILPEDEDGK